MSSYHDEAPRIFKTHETDTPDDFIRKAGEFDRFLWESVEIPYLEVDFETGKVTAHEGRHRAAAFINSKIKDFPVVIILIDLELHKKVVAMKLPETEILNDERIFTMPEKFFPEQSE